MDHLVALLALAAFGFAWRAGIKYLPPLNSWFKELISFAFGTLILLVIFSIYAAALDRISSEEPTTDIGEKYSQE